MVNFSQSASSQVFDMYICELVKKLKYENDKNVTLSAKNNYPGFELKTPFNI